MFRFLTAGESHGPGLTIVLEGIPAGVTITEDNIKVDLQRRQKGFGRGGRMKIEKDHAIIRSGVRHGISLGSPISLWIENKDYSGHSLRSGFATVSAESGADERSIMAMTGHKTTQMVRRYIREANLFKNNALNKIKI